MKKRLLVSVSLLAFSVASIAHAQIDAYGNTVGVPPGEAGTITVMPIMGAPGQPGMDPTLMGMSPMPTTDIRLMQNEKRETNRQLIERMRKMKEAQMYAPEFRMERNVLMVAGSTSLPAQAGGEVRVFRAENGAIVEDRMMRLPTSTPGKPVMFRVINRSQLGTSTMMMRATSSMPHGFVIRAEAASGSNAVFLRGGSSSSLPLPFLHAIFGEPTSSVRMNGGFEFNTEKPRLEMFMDTMLNMFKNKRESQINVIQNIQ